MISFIVYISVPHNYQKFTFMIASQTSSERETLLDAHEQLVSTTDLKGVITYSNEAFVVMPNSLRKNCWVKINIVRHSTMPKAAFADMWANLKQVKHGGYCKKSLKQEASIG